MVDTQSATETAEVGECGASQFGTRLVYSEESVFRQKCNDSWCALLCYMHVIVLIIVGAVLTSQYGGSVDLFAGGNGNNNNGNYWGTTTTIITTLPPNNNSSGAGGKILATLILQCFGGLFFGILWIQVMKKFAESIIKIMLYVTLTSWIVVALLGLIYGLIGLTVLGIILFLLNGIYTYCIWSRIPFSSALLKISSSIIQSYKGTICASFIMIPVTLIFFGIWCFMLLGMVFKVMYQATNNINGNTSGALNNVIYFLILLSVYWGFEIIKNILHTTVAGVTSTWYFSKNIKSPTAPAMKRALTTIFGSICYGSMIVAILQATKSFIKSQARGPAACIVVCILRCLERLVQYFNTYAYVQCCIYNIPFIQAAKNTLKLLMSKGIYAIINDQLTGLVLVCGGIMSFVTSFFIGFVMTKLFFPGVPGIPMLLGFIGGYLGYVLCCIVLRVIPSSIIALFVCFAEDPEALAKNRPEAYQKLIDSKDEIKNIATNAPPQQNNNGTSVQQEGKQAAEA